ncbi:MAG: hypothetical protein ACRCTE_03215 [Cellulosilyticaceae bacterium]
MNLRMIKYQPELNAVTGSVTATIIMGQLEYWFDKTKGEAFYKFLAPCEDECYREGDSWCEELGFTASEFRSAFGRIGKVYKSKKAYLESGDKFGGKLYLSYYDRIRRRTYYLRNQELIEVVLENEKKGHSTTKDSLVPITEDYAQDLQHQNKTEDDVQERGIHHQIIACYHEICEHLPRVTKLSKARRELIDRLVQQLGAKKETFCELFRKVAASDFLSGRGANSHWRASFDWLMNPVKARGILNGQYDQWTSSSASPNPKLQGVRQAFNKTYTHNWDYEQLEEMAYAHFVSQL